MAARPKITVDNLIITLEHIQAYCGAVTKGLRSIKNPEDVKIPLAPSPSRVILGRPRFAPGICPPPRTTRSRATR